MKRREFIVAGASATVAALIGKAEAASGPSEKMTATLPIKAGDLRLLSFARHGSSTPRIGVLLPNGHILDVGAAATAKKVKLAFDPSDMTSLIISGDKGLAQVRILHDTSKSVAGLDPTKVKMLPPIPRITRNIYAVGWNYLEHFEEGEAMRLTKGAKYPEHPVFFSKGVHTLNGPYDPIPFDPAVSTNYDWEGELAVIIGKRGYNIKEADAMDHVFGYTVINDTTARDVQQKKHGGQWFKGKSINGCAPMGPVIVLRDQLDSNNLHLTTRVNGIVKQHANTKQMYFKVPRIIAELSNGLTLEPGDIIATGTPPGVGGARKPPEFLKPGDVMETEIAEIGIIRNPIKQV